jgi:sulfatase maturation enzyme AslB (radical SAM superfamily)
MPSSSIRISRSGSASGANSRPTYSGWGPQSYNCGGEASKLILSQQDAFAPCIPCLTIELTSHCNLKCPYCANPSLKREYGEMSADMIERLAHECATEASIARLMEVPLGLIILSMDAATARTHILAN